MDSSRVSTFLISMLLIVYGSFRSLNMEEEERLKAKESGNDKLEKSMFFFEKKSNQFLINNLINFQLPLIDVQTLDTMQALCLPLGASISLLIMFFFFDSLSILFAFCTASKQSFLNYLMIIYINFNVILFCFFSNCINCARISAAASLPIHTFKMHSK